MNKYIVIGLLVMGLAVLTVLPSFSAVTVDVQVSVEEGIKAPAKTLDAIKGLSKDLILKSFKGDLGQSSMVLAETTILSEIRGGFRCETKATFLYEKTYTMKMNLIRWDFTRGKPGDVRTREDYVPESEQNIQTKQGSKPNKQMNAKEETQKGLKAPGGKGPDEPGGTTKARSDATSLTGEQVRTPWYNQAKGFANCPVSSSYADAWSQTYYIAYVMQWKTGQAYYARGSAASVGNNMNLFNYGSQLLYYNNIGHGAPWGLCMSNGNIYASTLVSAPYPYKWGIVWAVCLVNSCNSYQTPLRTSFYPSNWARVYISGKTPLYVSRSEWVDSWFWYYGLVQHKPANVALSQAISSAASHGYPGQFGITGYAPTSTF